MTSLTRRSAMAAAGIVILSALTAGVACADTLDDVTHSGTLTVGVFPDFPPFSFVNSEMSLQGYDVDVAKALADALKVKLKLVTVTGQNRVPYLTEKRVDVLMSVGRTKEREKVVEFTSPYAPYYVAAIGPKALKVESTADLAGKSIAVNRGTEEDKIITQAAPSADIKRFDNYNGVIQSFLAGQVQLIVVGNDVGAKILAEKSDLQPESKITLKVTPSWIAINKGEPKLKAAIDDAVKDMLASGKLDAASKAWLGKALDPTTLVDPIMEGR
ncbi:transporter substrate-binding domain-containing protein [Mesorhizobium sp.]|uniref:transporter substrate-binding domain-containing protein n=1 Tax=Mesorhizobium sp. TaxID=1871066 RepID=UPI000FE87109|nr:transporter substrate-binding domain-containing protein [Mesorhizobium sp.]RWI88874.1 MAG: transporter substrate-binding domain-containing protein [Mesorhizobium sp.]